MKFTTTIFQKGNNLGIEVPEQVIDKLGAGKRPPVIVTLNNYTYKNTVAVMQGKYLIALSSEHRKFVNVKGGDQLEIEIKVDDQPRTVDTPAALTERLNDNKDAKAFFDGLSPSMKKKIVTLIESAKTDDTHNKRLDKIISDLSQHIKP